MAIPFLSAAEGPANSNWCLAPGNYLVDSETDSSAKTASSYHVETGDQDVALAAAGWQTCRAGSPIIEEGIVMKRIWIQAG